MNDVRAQIIEKEEIKFLQFPKEEVLNSKTERHERNRTLKRALVLGNLEHQKVGIFFMDSNGFKKVETTIWGLTDKSVILKKSTVIPLERILRVS